MRGANEVVVMMFRYGWEEDQEASIRKERRKNASFYSYTEV